MTKKIDTSYFSSNARLQGVDVRNVEFKKEEDPYDGGISTRVINKGTGAESNRVRSDNDGNKFYTPDQLSNISEFEAKVRVYNNDIDNYATAKNTNINPSSIGRFNSVGNHNTYAMIYEDKKLGASKRQETINAMDIKPSDYLFVANVTHGSDNGFIGVNGEFVENWGAPVDTSLVKYYDQLDECVTDAVVFNHKNSIVGSGYNYMNSEVFIAIPKKDVPNK